MKRQYVRPLQVVAVVAITLATASIVGAFSPRPAELVSKRNLSRSLQNNSKNSPSNTRHQDLTNSRYESLSGRKNNNHGPSSSALLMGGNIFDDIQKFFSGGNNGDDENNGDTNDDYDFEAENRVATIPVKAIKPGGLRLFLMFYLMGMQNTPDRMSWKADQPTRDEYVIDYYYHDRTAMLTIELGEEHITIDRIGAVPSNAYMLQETVIVGGILDELHQCAFDDSIEEENRLLQLLDPKDAIEQARAALAFG